MTRDIKRLLLVRIIVKLCMISVVYSGDTMSIGLTQKLMKQLGDNVARIWYTRKFSRYEFFAKQDTNRIFTIIFSRITGPSWKGIARVMYCYKSVIVAN